MLLYEYQEKLYEKEEYIESGFAYVIKLFAAVLAGLAAIAIVGILSLFIGMLGSALALFCGGAVFFYIRDFFEPPEYKMVITEKGDKKTVEQINRTLEEYIKFDCEGNTDFLNLDKYFAALLINDVITKEVAEEISGLRDEVFAFDDEDKFANAMNYAKALNMVQKQTKYKTNPNMEIYYNMCCKYHQDLEAKEKAKAIAMARGSVKAFYDEYVYENTGGGGYSGYVGSVDFDDYDRDFDFDSDFLDDDGDYSMDPFVSDMLISNGYDPSDYGPGDGDLAFNDAFEEFEVESHFDSFWGDRD
ncbi:MAG: hypothetical protein PUB09_05180 [Firmicutes bacterium]|nr:hypothetical protein [Bacillota bacterium]